MERKLLAFTSAETGGLYGSLLSDMPTNVDAPLGMSLTQGQGVTENKCGTVGEAV